MEQESKDLGVDTTDELLISIKSNSLRETERARLVCLATEILPEAVMLPILISILRNETKRRLYFQAATGLGSLRSKKAQTELIEILRSDPKPSRRRLAAYSLRFRSKRNAEVHRAILSAAKHDVNTSVRGQAAEALAMGSKNAIPELHALVRDRSAVVRFWSIYALSQLGGEPEIHFLRKLVNDTAHPKSTGMDRTVGREARWAITQIKSRLLSSHSGKNPSGHESRRLSSRS